MAVNFPVNGTRAGDVILDKSDVGLGSVDNTSDADKPVSTATQNALDGKSDTGHTHPAATDTDAGFMSVAQVNKLAGIADNANNYTHPANHPPAIITQDANNRFVTDAEKAAWNAKVATGDTRLSDAREWSAETISQAEAEAGTATTRRAWTAQRARQAALASVKDNVNTGFISAAAMTMRGGETNLLTYSEDFDNAAWGKRIGSTIVPNDIIAPDGTLTADKHTNTNTTTNGTYLGRPGVFSTDNTVYCASAFVKRGSQSTAVISMYSRASLSDYLAAVFNFDTLAVTVNSSNSITDGKAGMIPVGDGWYRIWVSANMLTGTHELGARFAPSNWAIPASINSEYGYIWGAQVEVGDKPSAYTKTDAAPVTAPGPATLFAPNGLLLSGPLTAASGQIKFPATQNASTDANTLDDYEEGTWTPVLRDASAGNAATTTQSAGFYTKVGNLVHVRARLVGINTTGLTAGTQLYISGLPYGTNSAATQDHIVQVVRVNTSSAGNSGYGAAANNTTALALSNNTADGHGHMVAANLVSGSSHLYISGTYATN